MAKRVVWTDIAKKARRKILEYWDVHNSSKAYSRKLSILFKRKIHLLKSQNYIGIPTDYNELEPPWLVILRYSIRLTEMK